MITLLMLFNSQDAVICYKGLVTIVKLQIILSKMFYGKIEICYNEEGWINLLTKLIK